MRTPDLFGKLLDVSFGSCQLKDMHHLIGKCQLYAQFTVLWVTMIYYKTVTFLVFFNGKLYIYILVGRHFMLFFFSNFEVYQIRKIFKLYYWSK